MTEAKADMGIDTCKLRERAQQVARLDSARGLSQDLYAIADELDALRARVQELERKHLILFTADTTIEMLEEGLEARDKVTELESQRLKSEEWGNEMKRLANEQADLANSWIRRADVFKQQLAEARKGLADKRLREAIKNLPCLTPSRVEYGDCDCQVCKIKRDLRLDLKTATYAAYAATYAAHAADHRRMCNIIRNHWPMPKAIETAKQEGGE